MKTLKDSVFISIINKYINRTLFAENKSFPEMSG